MFWLAGLATSGSKSVLHLPYLSSPTASFFPISPCVSLLLSTANSPSELSVCMRQAQMTSSFLRSLCDRFQPLHGAGEQWQGDWPPPKTNCWLLRCWASLVTAAASGNREAPHVQEHRLRHFGKKPAGKCCFLSKQLIYFPNMVYQEYFKRATILLDDHNEQSFLYPRGHQPLGLRYFFL